MVCTITYRIKFSLFGLSCDFTDQIYGSEFFQFPSQRLEIQMSADQYLPN